MTAPLRRRARPGWTDAAAVAFVALTALAGVLALPRLPAEVVVGVHVGLDGQTSLTRVPSVLGAAVVPACGAAVLLAVLAVRAAVPLEAGSRERRLVVVGATLLLAGLAGAQAWLLWINL